MELADFLLARIAEDEDLARSVQQRHAFLEPYALADQALGLEWDDHMVYAPPLRVLAECDAKRLLLDGYDEAKHHYDEERDVDGSTKWNDGGAWAFLDKLEVWESVLKVITLPYADHPDYREEWRP